MSDKTASNIDDRRAALSSLMDGDGGACEAACRAWRGDALARADWHVYHLIGDVMRSDEHRSDAARDARLLSRVRERLQSEPVVLAPTPQPTGDAAAPFARRRRARAWLVPSAVAAGFVAVAGALVVTRVAAPDAAPADRAGVLAASPGPSPVRAATVQPPAPSTVEAAPAMVRSAELDRYLEAHRQAANGSLQMAPGGLVRQAAVAAPGR